MVLLIGLIWLINFGISWWNARIAGLVWAETKMMGGFPRFLTWMGAIMAACGFSWCFLIVFAIGTHYFFPMYLGDKALRAALSLGYLIIIPAVLFSGLFIWINSVAAAWRQRDLPSIGIAAWNTFAQIHNTYSAIEDMPAAFKEVGSFLSDAADSDDAKGVAVVLVLGVVFSALVGGIMLTAALIKRYAATIPLPERPNSRVPTHTH